MHHLDKYLIDAQTELENQKPSYGTPVDPVAFKKAMESAHAAGMSAHDAVRKFLNS
jgi:hypothetical protein